MAAIFGAVADGPNPYPSPQSVLPMSLLAPQAPSHFRDRHCRRPFRFDPLAAARDWLELQIITTIGLEVFRGLQFIRPMPLDQTGHPFQVQS